MEETYTIGGVPVDFPRRPYGAQLAMMNHVIRALTRREHALLELPTGSGKSLALLCSALAWQQHERAVGAGDEPTGEERAGGARRRRAPRVVVASRTHSQLKQLIRELRLSGYRPRVVVLGSREQLCTNKKVRAEAARGCGLGDACQRALSEGGCRLVHTAAKLKASPELEPPQLPDLEDVVSAAKAARACGYFGTRLRAPRAELVLCPYNYLLDPQVRASSGLDALLQGAAVFVDEAHALEDAAREAASARLSFGALREAALALGAAREHEALAELADELGVLHDLAQSLCSWLLAAAPTLRPSSFEAESRAWSGAAAARALEEVGLRAETVEVAEGAWARLSARAAERSGLGAGARDDDDEGGAADGARSAAHGGAQGAAGLGEAEQLLPRSVLVTLGTLFTAVRFMFCLEQDGGPAWRGVADGGALERGAPSGGGCAPRRDVLAHFTVAVLRELGGRAPAHGRRAPAAPAAAGDDLSLAFWCHHAAVAFEALASRARCVVLTSGTLAPLRSLESELGTRFPIQLEAAHVVPPHRVLALSLGVAPVAPSATAAGEPAAPPPARGARLLADFSNSESSSFLDGLGALLVRVCDVSPGGVLVFVPSYAMLDRLCARLRLTGAEAQLRQRKAAVLAEPRAAEQLGPMLRAFYAAVDGGGGALLCAVFRGKVAEGLDFKDSYCRTVLAVGLPFPHAKDLRVSLKRQHNDSVRGAARARARAAWPGAAQTQPPPQLAAADGGFMLGDGHGGGVAAAEAAAAAACAAEAARELQSAGLSGAEWYAQQAYRAINQAIGRCLRHRNDYGAVLLVDERFQRDAERILPALSRWVRARVQHTQSAELALGALADFFEKIGAEDGGGADGSWRARGGALEVAPAAAAAAPAAAGAEAAGDLRAWLKPRGGGAAEPGAALRIPAAAPLRERNETQPRAAPLPEQPGLGCAAQGSGGASSAAGEAVEGPVRGVPSAELPPALCTGSPGGSGREAEAGAPALEPCSKAAIRPCLAPRCGSARAPAASGDERARKKGRSAIKAAQHARASRGLSVPPAAPQSDDDDFDMRRTQAVSRRRQEGSRRAQ